MSQRTADLYLIDLIEAADAIERSVRGVTFDQFVGHQEKRDGILWNLMIIGEASTKLPPDVVQERPDVPWDQVRGFRNRIVHGYFALKWPIVWQIATTEVPRLREGAEGLLAKNFQETYRRRNERLAAGEPEAAS
jgi:uncharacterized protein with HEPN domain